MEEDMKPQTLKNYVYDKTLGKGAFGEVCLYNDKDRNSVAIKFEATKVRN